MKYTTTYYFKTSYLYQIRISIFEILGFLGS